MKIGVVTFPGSLDDRDAARAIQLAGGTAVPLFHASDDLKEVSAVVLPGGFSYGDYLRSGAIARFSPIMKEVIDFANKGGIVFGVCNGFQILCEAGLVPGVLLHNVHHQFVCKNTYIKAVNNDTLITSAVDTNKALKIPIAHGEGNFFAADDVIKKMEDNGQILFRYCDADGNITPEANPNGTRDNIAGVCNEKKNVFGMMPHPERAVDGHLGNTDGRSIFESLFNLVNA